jgi:hypothetical protein
VKRAGTAGAFWPTPVQEGILRAALLPDGAEVWQQLRPSVDVDLLPGELHRLLPLLARTLAEAGVDDPDLARLRGVRQYTWYRNQRLFADAGAVAATLTGRGVEPVLLRGAATVLRTHGDLGLRPMNDLDLLVRADGVEAVERNLRADGWRAQEQSSARRSLESSVTYANRDARRIVVHWSPTRNLAPAPPWWDLGPSVALGGTPVRLLDETSHLLQVLVDGARALSGSTLRWVADATILLRSAQPDWARLVDLARRLHVSTLVADTLAYLAATFDAEVDAEALRSLRASNPARRERYAHVLSGTEVARLGRLPELVGRHLRLTAARPLVTTVTAAPGFLRGVLDADGLRGAAVALARTGGQTLAGRGPEATAGPESSRP